MAQPGVSLRRDDPESGRVSEPYLVLARDAAAEDMAEIARTGVPRRARSSVGRAARDRGRAPMLDLADDARPLALAESSVDLDPTPVNGGVPGRRTITITGRGSERYVPARRRPQRPVYERPGFQPDRFAMWAVLLGVLLILVAATSAHAAPHVSHAASAAFTALHR